MTHPDQYDDNLTDNDSISSSLAGTDESLSSNDTILVQGTEFTKAEIEQANKPQPNVILNSTPDGNPNASGSYRDPERVNQRSNESSDSTDSNSGDIIAGAAKGVSQS